MNPKSIVKTNTYQVSVTEEGKIQIYGYSALMSADIAAKMAVGMLKAVQYVATELGNSLEDISETIQDTKQELTEL